MSARSARTARARQARLLVGGACALALLATAACGTEDAGSESATDPSTTASSPTVTESTTESADPKGKVGGSTEGGLLVVGDTVAPGQAQIVSASDVSGERTSMASALPDDAALEAYLADLDPRLADELRAAVKQVEMPSDHTLFASVVAVGCEEPTKITWTRTFDGIETGAELPDKGVQCLVPVTSVALFLVPGM